MALYHDAGEVDFELRELPRVAQPRRAWMADPAEFDVAYDINPHMRAEDGTLKRVDRALAREQWRALRNEFERLGLEVRTIAPLPGHPDLVFCANQALPLPAETTHDGRARFVLSNMRWPERRGEVPHVAHALATAGMEPIALETRERLEGMGDGLWHPGRALLWAGVGPRSSAEAWSEVARHVTAPVALLELVAPAFYHLDTALALLAEDTCLWLPDALSARSRALVERLVPRRIEADPREAHALLACNACSPDGRNVLMQRGCERTGAALRAAGFTVRELETGEFLKSGGSVFCMKLLA
jgi:N-dimethylarginine dimethylaminohydrolase